MTSGGEGGAIYVLTEHMLMNSVFSSDVATSSGFSVYSSSYTSSLSGSLRSGRLGINTVNGNTNMNMDSKGRQRDQDMFVEGMLEGSDSVGDEKQRLNANVKNINGEDE
eukprot:gnl/Chilomastix_caulleri/5154.p1 GENE.gnl/Chilomastix_caulleri/5154~~gnl/Chilomastix_caulleri/5154.p1  ORF type:complete len:125 (-),score=43.07 gnl/Chilomastix_caulleri/5154:19-345(-)